MKHWTGCDPALSHLPRRGAAQRRVVPGPARADHHRGRVRGCAPRRSGRASVEGATCFGSRPLWACNRADEHRRRTAKAARMYRCAHRGDRMPATSTVEQRAAPSGAPRTELLASDTSCKRRSAEAGRGSAAGPPGPEPGAPSSCEVLAGLTERRRKLLSSTTQARSPAELFADRGSRPH